MPLIGVQRLLASVLRDPQAYRRFLADRAAYGASFGLSPREITSLMHIDETGLAIYRRRLREKTISCQRGAVKAD